MSRRSFPFKYLGIPRSDQKLANKDCSIIEECFQKDLLAAGKENTYQWEED